MSKSEKEKEQLLQKYSHLERIDIIEMLESERFKQSVMSSRMSYVEGILEFYKKRVASLQDAEKFLEIDWRKYIQ